ncbi:uncharacterized protein LOC142624974 [Castanea sativa]|uniref:uncharacterized protein LOC142624974 n=1 Tax=Castanea sativa TaxID=21020 RepID=UPI003F64A2AB
METNCTGKKSFMAMKLDMSKTYDRVECFFLEQILLKLGFQVSWVELIMECITLVSYSILVNGEPKGMITPSRGLRQGDPLSPYLFIFCVKGLNALLCGVASRGEIHGFSICKNGPKLTHLFFADECLIFCKSTLEECRKIQELLGHYEMASGQMINKEKTTLSFSKNTDVTTQEAIKVALQVPAIGHYEKYLELPSFVWCFIHNKDTLVYKVFSVKYFPNGNVLDALVHPKSSYAWKSILQAQEVIHKGAIWRIGNGEAINIWDHQWLPELGCSKIVSPRADSNVVRKVGGIYVGEVEAEDVLIWPLSPSGSYSVQSAYRLLMEAKNSTLPSSSSPMSSNSIWKKIWKLKVPNKVCHFLWRATRDSFPTKKNLKHQHLLLDDTCDGCFRCALFAMIAWCLWERQNRVRERQRTWQLHEVGRRARDLVQEYWDIHFKEKLIHVCPLTVRWSPPSAECYKINFDATILEEALAGKRAVEFARELSFFNVQIEGDCLRVIQAL